MFFTKRETSVATSLKLQSLPAWGINTMALLCRSWQSSTSHSSCSVKMENQHLEWWNSLAKGVREEQVLITGWYWKKNTFPGKKIHVPWKKYLQPLEKKFRLLWPCGPLVVWSFGPLVVWSSGPLVQWSSGPVVLWSFGPLVLWSSGPVVLWSSGPLVLWSSGPVVLWSSGPVVLWSCGRVVLWSSGPKNSMNCERIT